MVFWAIPVAVLSKLCKSTSFGRWWLSVTIWWRLAGAQVFFSMAVSSAGVVILHKLLYIVYPPVNGSALAETIVTQLIHTLEWRCRPHWSSCSLALACYSFVVTMMNGIMSTRSIQQVSWYTGKPVNTSYVDLGLESMLHEGVDWVQHNWC